MIIWFGVCLQTSQREIQYLSRLLLRSAEADRKRGGCMPVQEWRKTKSNAFERLRKVSLTPLSSCQVSTSGVLLGKEVLKRCVQNISPPGEVWLKLFAEKKDFWIYTELSLRPKHLGCSKHVQIKLQTLFILHFPLQDLLYKMFLSIFPQSTSPEKVHSGKHRSS